MKHFPLLPLIAMVFSVASYAQEDTLSVSSARYDTVRIDAKPYYNPMVRNGAGAKETAKNSFTVDGFVDALDLSGQKSKDIETLSHLLTDSFDTDGEKVRALFYWMTQNISYDCKKFHNRRFEPFHCGRNEKYAHAIERWEWEMARTTLVTKKGICGDYALLFYYLCGFAGIECRYITGYAVNPSDNLISPSMSEKAANHAWNAVMIDGEWHLLDVTWASGYADKGVKNFTRELDETYYLTPPEVMIQNHHPKDKQWQLLDHPVKMKEFAETFNEKQKEKFQCRRTGK